MSIIELKQKLSDYYTGKLDKQIELKSEELKYPPIDIDDVLIKVQTSNLNSSPVEREVLNLMGNKQLDNLIRRKACIEKFIRDQTPIDQKLLEHTYLNNFHYEKICQLLHVSKSTYYRDVTYLACELGKYLAWEV